MKRPSLEQFLAWRAALRDYMDAADRKNPPASEANLRQLDRWLAKKAAKARRREARGE